MTRISKCIEVEGNRYERKFLYDARNHLQVGDQVVVYVHGSDPRKYFAQAVEEDIIFEKVKEQNDTGYYKIKRKGGVAAWLRGRLTGLFK